MEGGALLEAWLAGRSIARGLPPSVADRGGFRVDTGSDGEVRRWVFETVGPGLIALGREIDAPLHPIKLCGPMSALLGALPAGWSPHPPAYFMRSRRLWKTAPVPPGYDIRIARTGDVTTIRFVDQAGDIVASGYGAETGDAFVYDRIWTAPDHRRRGLGAALMWALRAQRRDGTVPDLLTATAAGRALYESLGWDILSDYSTASIP